ncbi:MAG: riboflavin synthase [Candidatus Levybacteria bacterium]|nr:riboflavin synthase [Candidatus Levybacteria bacterium]
MFTGIITHLGKVAEATDTRLVIQTDKDFLKKLSRGISIAADGICLTVVSYDKKSFTIDFMPETSKRTSIQYLQKNSLVNLELPVNSETFLSGHVVQGHVDAVGKIKSIEKKGNSRIFTFSIPKNISKYIVEKGSITVNGISLTVINITKNYFTVGIIPHTWDNTMLHTAKVGDLVNIEVDILAKYLEKLIGKTK